LVVPRAWFTEATHPLAFPMFRDLSLAWARVCDSIAEQGYKVVLAALQAGEKGLDDEQVAAQIATHMKHPAQARVVRARSWEELLRMSAQSRAAICMRLHGALAAVLAATPVIGLAYDPKVRVFMESVGMGDFVAGLDDFAANDGIVLSVLWRRLEKEAGRVSSELAAAVPGLRDAADAGHRALCDIVFSTSGSGP